MMSQAFKLLRTTAVSILGCLALSFLLISPALAQTQSKRLILKDGSYQLATKWEIKGDRVRYYSAERYTWEELPKSLVDWDATNKYQSDRAAGKAAGDAQAQAEAEAERKAEEARSPTIAPGLKLPDSGGIFVLDTYKQQPQLVELVQNNSEINKHMGKNIMRAVINPLPTGPRQTVELKGLRARVQAHTATPDIYINVNYDNDDTADNDASNAADAKTGNTKAQDKKGSSAKPTAPPLNLNDRFKIVRVEKKPKEQVRVVSNMKIGLTGHIKEQQNVLATSTQSISSDWVKITPTAPLEPGEYAVVEMLDAKQMNLFVWDFGVDPSAPQNPSAWKPATTQKTETGTNESPVLGKRPR
jgi:hypothetical protein